MSCSNGIQLTLEELKNFRFPVTNCGFLTLSFTTGAITVWVITKQLFTLKDVHNPDTRSNKCNVNAIKPLLFSDNTRSILIALTVVSN